MMKLRPKATRLTRRTSGQFSRDKAPTYLSVHLSATRTRRLSIDDRESEAKIDAQPTTHPAASNEITSALSVVR